MQKVYPMVSFTTSFGLFPTSLVLYFLSSLYIKRNIFSIRQLGDVSNKSGVKDIIGEEARFYAINNILGQRLDKLSKIQRYNFVSSTLQYLNYQFFLKI